MSNYQLLNNVEHRSIRVITRRGARFGDKRDVRADIPGRDAGVQAHYPILLHRPSETERFIPIALFGFEAGETCSWRATRGAPPTSRSPSGGKPFAVASQRRNPAAAGEPVIAIDLDSPRVSESEGTPLFREHGGNSEYLEEVATLLEATRTGHERSAALVSALLEHELIEGITLDITLEDRSRNQLQGMYAVNDTRLQQLDASALGELNRAGFLLPAYMMLASQSQLGRLVEQRNVRLGGG